MNIKEFEVMKKKPFDLTLVFELFEGSNLDKKAYKIIEKNDDLFAEAKMDNEVFRYNISNKMSLRKYLTLGMDRETMVYIIRRLLEAESFFDEKGLSKSYLLYDADLILVDKDSEEITFIVMPANDHGLEVKPLRAFFKEVVANAIYDDDENLDYVGRLLTYVNSHKEIHQNEVMALLSEIETKAADAEKAAKAAVVAMPQQGAPVKEEEQEAPVVSEEPDDLTRIYRAGDLKENKAGVGVAAAGIGAAMKSVEILLEPEPIEMPEPNMEKSSPAAVSEEKIPKVEEIPEMSEEISLSKAALEAPSFSGVENMDISLKSEKAEDIEIPEIILPPMETETEAPARTEKPVGKRNDSIRLAVDPLPEVKAKGPESVQAANESQKQNGIPVKKHPYLIRTKTQEIITVDKDEFKIGKIPGMADYLLSDNPAVSRMHAIIHNVEGTYYICDNYSTNATYLNGERLEPGKNYLLLNGVKISLANDEFTYLLEQK